MLRQYSFTDALLTLLTDFLRKRKQRIVLNGQHYPWTDTKAVVPQDFILGPLLFLLHSNDLMENLYFNPKHFVDGTSLFLTVTDEALSSYRLNKS